MSAQFARILLPASTVPAGHGGGETPSAETGGLLARAVAGPGLWEDLLGELRRAGLIAELLADGVITAAVAQAEHGHKLDRVLTAGVTAMCVIVGALFPDQGYDLVLTRAFKIPGLAVKPGTVTPSGPALSRARALLGEQVMRRIFELDAGRTDLELGIGATWHGMETTGMDGTTIELFGNDELGWAGQCQARFGNHPVQVVHEWNTAVHVQASEADPRKRAFTLDELQALFDHADEQAVRVRGGGRKGWLPVFRDAAALKVAYGFGLRRTEAAMLDVADFGPNPHALEFGEYGVCQVRFGKAMKGSPPKHRSVLTVWEWVPQVLAQWIGEARPLMPSAGASAALWPSERGPRIGSGTLHKRFCEYRDALGLDEGLDFHSLRRSYVTHLIEGGWDPLFVQQQAGHEHASTTSIYTCVSSDFRTRTLRRALDATAAAAVRPGRSA